MNVNKRALSILLAVAMVCSLIVFSSAGSEAPGIYPVAPDTIGAGQAQIVGQRTVVSHGSLGSNPTIETTFRIHTDTTMWNVYGTALLMTYDADYLTIARSSIDYLVNTDAGAQDNDFLVTFDYVDNADRSQGVYLILANKGDAPTQPQHFPEGHVLEISFYFKPTAAFATMDPADGTEVTLEMRPDMTTAIDFYTWTASQDYERIGSGKNIAAKPAVVTYSASMLSYDTGLGVRSAENGGMNAFKSKVVTAGATETLADGTGLVIPAGGGNVAKAFDHWKDEENNTYEGGMPARMGADGLDLTAVYSDDKNEDGIADSKQMKISYTKRTGDSGTLEAPATVTDNGLFTTEGSSKVIYVTKNDTIGDSIATLDLTGLTGWSFIGYFIGDTKYEAADLDTMSVTEPLAFELRAMLDANGNGIDDRDLVTLEFYDTDDNLIDTIDVLDGTPYNVYSDPDKNTAAKSGTAGEGGNDPTVVTVPSVPNFIPGGKFMGWDVEPLKDSSDKITEVKVFPLYTDEQPVHIPDLIDPDTEEPIIPPVVDMVPDSTVHHRGIDGSTIKTTRIVAGSDPFAIVNPVAGQHAQVPTRDTDGNPFLGWVLSGPDAAPGLNGEDVYYLDPYYADPIEVTITNPNSKTDTTDDEALTGFDGTEVPVDSTYEILDENGDEDVSGVLKDDMIAGEIVLPATEDMPKRNNDGDIFTGDWTVSKETGAGGKPNYVIAPEYVAPTDDDVVTIVDEDVLGDGRGLFVLKGAYANDRTATATFYLNIAEEAATAADAPRLKADAQGTYGFDEISNPRTIIGDISSVRYVKEENVGGVNYGVFEVTYSTVKSGVVELSLSYKTLDMGSYYIVTVADSNKDGTVNSADISSSARVVNSKTVVPPKGTEGDFFFELLDVNMDAAVNSVDITVVARMINSKTASN